MISKMIDLRRFNHMKSTDQITLIGKSFHALLELPALLLTEAGDRAANHQVNQSHAHLPRSLGLLPHLRPPNLVRVGKLHRILVPSSNRPHRRVFRTPPPDTGRLPDLHLHLSPLLAPRSLACWPGIPPVGPDLSDQLAEVLSVPDGVPVNVKRGSAGASLPPPVDVDLVFDPVQVPHHAVA